MSGLHFFRLCYYDKKCKVVRFFLNLFSVFFFVGAIAYIALSNSTEVNSSEQNVMTAAGIICIVLFILCVVFSKKLKKKINQPIIMAQRQAAEQARLVHQQELEERNALFKCQGSHAYGLPVAKESALAASIPTSNAPLSPGP